MSSKNPIKLCNFSLLPNHFIHMILIIFRYSSVQLLGDLLYKISGVSGKMTTETAGEDDNFGTEASQRAVVEVLGRNR